MELTIKELAPYLPYDVNALCIRTNEVRKVTLLHFTYDLKTVGHNHLLYDGLLLEHHKLILRPLSDLTKEIEHKGQKLVPIVELLKIKHKGWVIEKLNTRYSEIEFSQNNNYAKACFSFMATLSIEVWLKFTENEPYWVCEKLNEWHFDWKDNLIENNLAIDINTLNQ